MDKASVPKATLGRLPHYLRCLRELPPQQMYVSAPVIAKHLALGEVQVRKDLNLVSGTGKPKVGYLKADLMEQLEEYLGCGRPNAAVLVGAGKLGRALLEYDGFEDYGVEILAAFDCNEQPISLGNQREVLPVHCLEEFCREHSVRIGIITVGAGSAQEVCDRMLKSGIAAIWNFAPCDLQVPAGVLLRQERLVLSLAHLNNQLNHRAGDMEANENLN